MGYPTTPFRGAPVGVHLPPGGVSPASYIFSGGSPPFPGVAALVEAGGLFPAFYIPVATPGVSPLGVPFCVLGQLTGQRCNPGMEPCALFTLPAFSILSERGRPRGAPPGAWESPGPKRFWGSPGPCGPLSPPRLGRLWTAWALRPPLSPGQRGGKGPGEKPPFPGGRPPSQRFLPGFPRLGAPSARGKPPGGPGKPPAGSPPGPKPGEGPPGFTSFPPLTRGPKKGCPPNFPPAAGNPPGFGRPFHLEGGALSTQRAPKGRPWGTQTPANPGALRNG